MDVKEFLQYEKMVKINLTESQQEWIIQKANMLDDSFSSLSSIDTEGIEPLISPLGLQNPLREDVAKKSIHSRRNISQFASAIPWLFPSPENHRIGGYSFEK